MEIQLCLVAVTLFLLQSFVRPDLPVDYALEDRYVSLTVTPEDKGLPVYTRRVAVSWRMANVSVDDRIAIFGTNAKDKDLATIVPIRAFSVNTTLGFIRTDLSFDFIILRNVCYQGWSETRCFLYWVKYIRNETIFASNCLKIRPKWMEELSDAAKSTKLKELFLPGTHNSGSYKFKPQTYYFSTKYIYTQDVDIMGQLCLGARYFDLRVGYHNTTNQLWWVAHNVVSIRPLSDVLDDLSAFLDATREIVILDFYKFPTGFSNDDSTYTALFKYVNDNFKNRMTYPSWESTLGDLQRLGSRLLVTFNHVPKTSSQDDYLWKSPPRYWPNAHTLEEFVKNVKSYIKKKQLKTQSVLMGEMTPRSEEVLFNLNGGLRKMSSTVNTEINTWFGQKEFIDKCNIVAMDFIQGTDVVDAAVYWNTKNKP